MDNKKCRTASPKESLQLLFWSPGSKNLPYVLRSTLLLLFTPGLPDTVMNEMSQHQIKILAYSIQKRKESKYTFSQYCFLSSQDVYLVIDHR